MSNLGENSKVAKDDQTNDYVVYEGEFPLKVVKFDKGQGVQK